MNVRNYNIYFHTHTISGIIICVFLYVIFFAGSFAFFKDEISAWQQESSYAAAADKSFSYDQLLDSLDQEHQLYGRDIQFFLYPETERSYVNFGPSKDTTLMPAAENTGLYFNYNYLSKTIGNYAENYDLGEFFYRLHFLAPLNQAVPFRLGFAFGYLIAGIVSFLFLFALITGLLLHWDKIKSNFFLFRPWSKLKTVWTDIHTVLGVIGFPFQFVFAVTGIVLIFNMALTAPFTKLLYDGNGEKLFEDLEYSRPLESDFQKVKMKEIPSVNAYISRLANEWPGSYTRRITIKNYGDEGMRMMVEVDADYNKSFAGTGYRIYDMNSGKVTSSKSPFSDTSYVSKVKSILYRLHFGDFGGLFLRIVYFILGISGCVVILSGVLIWLVARDKKNVPDYKRKANFWIANIFLAICLTMFPVTALSFIVVKLSPVVNQTFIYQVYFYSWLLFSTYYVVRRNLHKTNRECLLSGSILSLLVPMANGFATGNWFWGNWLAGAEDLFFVDIFFIVLSITGFYAYLRVRKHHFTKIALSPVKETA